MFCNFILQPWCNILEEQNWREVSSHQVEPKKVKTPKERKWRQRKTSYMQLCSETWRRNLQFFCIFLKFHHLIIVKYRVVGDCIKTSLHILYNDTTTLVSIPNFDLNSIPHFRQPKAFLILRYKYTKQNSHPNLKQQPIIAP